MEPNAALQEPPVEPSVPTVLSGVRASCGGETRNWEGSRYPQASSLVWAHGTKNSHTRNQHNEKQSPPTPTPSSGKNVA